MASISKPFSKLVNKGAVTPCILTGIAITSDNKLLLCGYEPSRVYVYNDCQTYEDEISFTSPPWSITVLSSTKQAVVTLPDDKSIQFINTKNTDGDNKLEIGVKKEIGEVCYGVTAVKDKIYLGGNNKIIILKTDGSRVSKITTDDCITFNLLYDERNDQLLLRQSGRLCCINLDGHVTYIYKISGYRGLAVDQQGNVYISGDDTHDIHRLSPVGILQEVLSSKCGDIHEPRGMTFNNDFTKLFVINRRGNEVSMFGC